MKRKFLILFLLLFYLTNCNNNTGEEKRFAEQRLAVGRESSIPVKLILYAKKMPGWNTIFDRVVKVSSLYDHRVVGNGLWQLNHNGTAAVDPSLYRLLQQSVELAAAANGLFDPTIGILTNLWQIDKGIVLPFDKDIQKAKTLVDYKKIEFFEDNTVTIPAGFQIDLGGIAKGSIADDLTGYLRAAGYSNFLVDIGSDILVSGLKPGQEQWIIAVKHPRQKNADDYLTKFSIGEVNKQIVVVTSGDYEQFKIIDGVRYHHILDPRTGYPALENISVTVIGPDFTKAVVYAKAAFIMGFNEGIQYLEEMQDMEGLVVREKSGKLEALTTSGFPVKAADLNL